MRELFKGNFFKDFTCNSKRFKALLHSVNSNTVFKDSLISVSFKWNPETNSPFKSIMKKLCEFYRMVIWRSNDKILFEQNENFNLTTMEN